MTQLRGAAQTARADAGAPGQVLDRIDDVFAQVFADDQRVAYVFAFGDRGDAQPVGQGGRQIFQAVNRQVDAMIEQGLFDLFREDALAADLRQRGLGQFIAGGLDDLDADDQPLVDFLEPVLHPVGLPERELAAARADDQVRHKTNPESKIQRLWRNYILKVGSLTIARARREK